MSDPTPPKGDRPDEHDWSDADQQPAPEDATPDEQAGPPRCTECGAELAEDQTYCLECGHPTPRAPRLTRGSRYGLAIAAGLVVLGLGAGALAYAVSQDDDPKGATAGSTITDVTPTAPINDPSTEFTFPTDIGTGELPPDTWTAIVSSVRDETEARDTADRLAGGGEESGVLFSSDYPDLRPGYWVVYSGEFPSRDGAAAHARSLAGSFPGAYPRYIDG